MYRLYYSESCLRNHSVESRVGENHTHGLVGEVNRQPRMRKKTWDFVIFPLIFFFFFS